MISSLPAITKAAEAIRQGTLTPTELVEFCLDRIHRLDGQIRAWVSVDEAGALREAGRLTELARRGELAGPLHGIPVGIKDIVDVAGWPTQCGSPLREGRGARSDAEIVRRLRAAGAIFLGKTVTTEFASFDPPPTRNPWDLQRTPGGSSSGSAAAVALGMCLAAIGTQTGGSIVRPASYCGVVGLKPTFGAVSLAGIEPLSWHMDHAGPITHCVEDAAVLFEVLASGTSQASSQDKPALVRLTGFFEERADEAVRRAFALAIERLEKAGLGVATAPQPLADFEELLASHRCLMAVEAAEHHRRAFNAARERFGPQIRKLIEEGLAATAVDYAAALRHQSRISAELPSWFANGRIWLTPSTTTAAPGLDTTGDPAFNSPWSFTGLPTVTVPCGLTEGGLPCGLQLIGAPGSETQLLSVAAKCERVFHFDFDCVPSLVVNQQL